MDQYHIIGRSELHYVPESFLKPLNDVQRMVDLTSISEDVCINFLSENVRTLGNANVALEVGENSSVLSRHIRQTLKGTCVDERVIRYGSVLVLIQFKIEMSYINLSYPGPHIGTADAV